MNNLIISQSKNGKGVFTNENFKFGEVITTFHGKILYFNEIISNSQEDDHYIQIGNGIYLEPNDFGYYINHSCYPNSGIRFNDKNIELIAIRGINRTEEITLDYSTSMDEDYWEMDCNCGYENCRGRIRDFKYLPETIQQKYIKLGIVPEFILKKLN